MFEAIKRLFTEKPEPLITSVPDSSCMRRAWVILDDGRVGYIHHYKDDGHFGVRPVDLETGRHFANTSKHWSEEQRRQVPEELALSVNGFRGAKRDEIPVMYRQHVRQ
jgi:hypothetical protein